MLYEQIFDDYKSAMKNHEEVKKSILNYLFAQLKNKKIELQKDPDDADVITIIKKEVKARQESIEFLEKAGKTGDVTSEQGAIAILMTYLPAMLSKEKLTELVQDVITKQGIADIGKQRGEIVKAIMAEHKAETDGKLLQEVINSLIN